MEWRTWGVAVMCTSTGPSRGRRSPPAYSPCAAGHSQCTPKSLHRARLIAAKARAEGVEDLSGKDRTLPSNCVRIDGEEAIRPNPTWSPLFIPWAGSDGEPVRITGMVAAREHEDGQPLAVSKADHDDGTILADGGIVLECYPCPHDLAGIRPTIALGLVGPSDPACVCVGSTVRGLSGPCRI